MNRAQKTAAVSDMEKSVGSSSAVLVVRYGSISHKEMEEVRRELRRGSCNMKVMRNSVVKVFAKSRGYEALDRYLKQQNAFIWGDDLLKLIKIATDSGKKGRDFEPVAAIADSQVIGKDYIESLAALSSSEELYGKLIGTLNSPISGVGRFLQLNARRLFLALGERSG